MADERQIDPEPYERFYQRWCEGGRGNGGRLLVYEGPRAAGGFPARSRTELIWVDADRSQGAKPILRAKGFCLLGARSKGMRVTSQSI